MRIIFVPSDREMVIGIKMSFLLLKFFFLARVNHFFTKTFRITRLPGLTEGLSVAGLIGVGSPPAEVIGIDREVGLELGFVAEIHELAAFGARKGLQIPPFFVTTGEEPADVVLLSVGQTRTDIDRSVRLVCGLLPINPKQLVWVPKIREHGHIAERQIVEFSSMVSCGEINFNESMATLSRDMQRTNPHMFFGPPRVWEQLQQAVIGKFGGKDALAAALAADPEGMGKLILKGLGFGEVEYCLTAAAPTPPALIHWWDELGLPLMEGFGQTEAMGVILSDPNNRRIGSIGKTIGEVEYKLTAQGELAIKASGCTPGYYKQPDKTAELIQDGWLHTGDKVRVDEDGFIDTFDNWCEEWVQHVKKEEGIDELTEEHRKVVEVLQDYYKKNGIAPMVRVLSKVTGFKPKPIYELFPSGPGKGACKMAGLPKPTGCV